MIKVQYSLYAGMVQNTQSHHIRRKYGIDVYVEERTNYLRNMLTGHSTHNPHEGGRVDRIVKCK